MRQREGAARCSARGREKKSAGRAEPRGRCYGIVDCVQVAPRCHRGCLSGRPGLRECLPHLHCLALAMVWSARENRSEEHTSELQSHLNLVCRLLLEKKKKKTTPH